MDKLWIGCKPLSMALALGFSLACSSEKVERKGAMKPILGPEAVGGDLSKYSEAARRRLEAVLFNERFDGVIESEIVQDVIRLQAGATTFQEFMVDMLPIARLYSVPATSGFRVGA